MRLAISARAYKDCAVLHCAGDIVYRHEADHLLDAVGLLKRERLLIDLYEMRAIDAYGIGGLIEINDSAKTLESYKAGLHAATSRSFVCENCEQECFAPKEETICRVARIPEVTVSVSIK